MALCCVIYTFLYRTYPKDRDRARMEAMIESEIQLMELESSHTRGIQVQIESDGKTIIPLPFEDYSDERTLLVTRWSHRCRVEAWNDFSLELESLSRIWLYR